MKWLESIKSVLDGEKSGEKVFGSLAEAAEYAKKNPGGAIPPNPFNKPQAEVPSKPKPLKFY